MSLKDKVVVVLVEEQYQVLEVWYPVLRLREEHATVLIVGSGTGHRYLSKEGYPVEVNASASEVSAKDCAAVIIPGGWAPDFLRRHQSVIRLVQQIHECGGIVGSICHGGWMLISAGLAKSVKMTSFFAIRDDLVSAGAIWVDEPVVVDKQIVTSRKPDDLPYFVKTIINLLNAK